jgi:AbrB family looped-hinge helix DNA binding protein
MEATLSSKNQATIPKAVREYLHLRPGDRFKFFFQRRWGCCDPAQDPDIGAQRPRSKIFPARFSQADGCGN